MPGGVGSRFLAYDEPGQLLWALHYQLSVAVVVGFIAVEGVAADTGVVMLVYFHRGIAASRATWPELHDVVVDTAVERVRPLLMTVSAIVFGLLRRARIPTDWRRARLAARRSSLFLA